MESGELYLADFLCRTRRTRPERMPRPAIISQSGCIHLLPLLLLGMLGTTLEDREDIAMPLLEKL